MSRVIARQILFFPRKALKRSSRLMPSLLVESGAVVYGCVGRDANLLMRWRLEMASGGGVYGSKFFLFVSVSARTHTNDRKKLIFLTLNYFTPLHFSEHKFTLLYFTLHSSSLFALLGSSGTRRTTCNAIYLCQPERHYEIQQRRAAVFVRIAAPGGRTFEQADWRTGGRAGGLADSG